MTESHAQKKEILWDFLFLMVCIGLFFGLLLGTRSLSVPDEARYTEIPRWMVATGDYVTPRLNGIKYFEKPPLFYWLQACSIGLFGVWEWSLRFWPAFLSLITCLSTYGMGRLLFSRTAGIFAALLLASSLLFNFLARLIILDVAVTCFMTLSLYSFLLYALGTLPRQRDSSWANLYIPPYKRAFLAGFFIFGALAVLSKGLIGIILPGGILCLWALLLKHPRLILSAFTPWGLALFLLITLPWHLWVGYRNPEFFWFYFIHEHLLRYTTSIHSRVQPFWFFFPLITFGWYPWVGTFLLTLGTKLRIWREQGVRSHPLPFLLLSWSGFIVFFFSLSKSKLIPYIAPAFPPLALLMGQTMGQIWQSRRAPRSLWSLSSGTSTVVFIAFCLVAHQRGLLDQPDFVFPFMGVSTCLFLLIWAPWGVAKLYSVRGGIVTQMALALGLICGIQMGWEIADPRSVKSLVQHILTLRKHGDRVATIRYDAQDIAPYLGERVTVIGYRTGELSFGMSHEDTSAWMISEEAFLDQCHTGQIFYVIVQREDWSPHWSSRLPHFKILAQKNDYLLVTNAPS